jgi:hypothetical protein
VQIINRSPEVREQREEARQAKLQQQGIFQHREDDGLPSKWDIDVMLQDLEHSYMEIYKHFKAYKPDEFYEMFPHLKPQPKELKDEYEPRPNRPRQQKNDVDNSMLIQYPLPEKYKAYGGDDDSDDDTETKEKTAQCRRRMKKFSSTQMLEKHIHKKNPCKPLSIKH